MTTHDTVDHPSLETLIDLCDDLAWGRPADEAKLFQLTSPQSGSPLFVRLAEAFGLMLVKVEGRELENARLIEQLNARNAELEAARWELLERNAVLLHAVQDTYEIKNVIARCPAMRRVMTLALSIARRPINTLVLGPTGSGKEVIAKLIHTQSPRRDGPFVAVNCTAIPDSLFESEMFGIEKGVATGVSARKGLIEEAGGGTLFLDELAEMTLPNQAKLLRVLEEREVLRVGSAKPIPVDIKIIAATHVPLAEAVQAGKFREDLYYRINVAEIQLPFLRERGDDILLMAQNFLERHCALLHRPRLSITPQAQDLLLHYPWPGNVRELNNEMERAAALSPGSCVDVNDLSPRLLAAVRRAAPNQSRTNDAPNDASNDAPNDAEDSPHDAHHAHDDATQTPPRQAIFDLETLERSAIMRALEHTEGNRSRAAILLGVTREGLRKKLLRMGDA